MLPVHIPERGTQRRLAPLAQKQTRLKLMPQFQAEVPHPLREDLPPFLAASRVTTPAVGVLFLVFISEGVFKRAAMQIQRDDICGGKSALGEIGQEEFIDDAGADDSDPTLSRSSRMGRNDDADLFACCVQGVFRTVVERAHNPAFRVLDLLVCGQVQASLHLSSIQQPIIFATRDIR